MEQFRLTRDGGQRGAFVNLRTFDSLTSWATTSFSKTLFPGAMYENCKNVFLGLIYNGMSESIQFLRKFFFRPMLLNRKPGAL
jgi:hypothetical protein